MSLRLVVCDAPVGRTDASRADFVCSWTDGGPDACWVTAAGRLDVAAVPELERTLGWCRRRARLVVLDLRALSFIDGSAVRAVVNASNRARRDGHRLVLLRGPSNVDRMFKPLASSQQLEIGDLARGIPPAQVLLQLGDGDLAS
jgi:anti-anti-sigma factor